MWKDKIIQRNRFVRKIYKLKVLFYKLKVTFHKMKVAFYIWSANFLSDVQNKRNSKKSLEKVYNFEIQEIQQSFQVVYPFSPYLFSK